MLSHGGMGLSYLVEAVDKHGGEKSLNLNAKKRPRRPKTDKKRKIVK